MANNGDDNNNNLQQIPVSSNPNPNNTDGGDDPSGKSPSPRDLIRSVASKAAAQPLHYSDDPAVWGVLTAISTKALQLKGLNMILTGNKHTIGRNVANKRFQIMSDNISQRHCKIYRKKVAAEGQSRLVILKDKSKNGTFLNWKKLNINSLHSPVSKLHHGDIISFGGPPHEELAYAFVFREVVKPTLKKAEDDTKSTYDLRRRDGIVASENLISLYDFQRLQWSNMELRYQLKDQVATIDRLRNKHLAATKLHELELEKERCSLVETLRSKLEETTQKLVGSDNKARQLESQLSEEQRVSSLGKRKVQELEHETSRLKKELESEKELRKQSKDQVATIDQLCNEHLAATKLHEVKVQELEHETSRLRKELESEKAGREEACAKVSALELEMNAKMRDLEYEKCRLKTATERRMLWETQLRVFNSTTKEMSILFAMQQEQLKSMQETLQDEVYHEKISLNINPNNDRDNHAASILLDMGRA